MDAKTVQIMRDAVQQAVAAEFRTMAANAQQANAASERRFISEMHEAVKASEERLHERLSSHEATMRGLQSQLHGTFKTVEEPSGLMSSSPRRVSCAGARPAAPRRSNRDFAERSEMSLSTTELVDMTGAPDAGDVEELQAHQNWALVEGDPDMQKMLTDVRKQMEVLAKPVDQLAERSRMLTRQQTELAAGLGDKGTLHVRLCNAKDLRAADANGLSDPYVKLTLGGLTHKSKVEKRTLNPTFNEMFEFEGVLGELVADPLQLIVFDRDMGFSDDKIGLAELCLSGPWIHGVDRDMTAQLDQGYVTLQACWMSDEAPKQRTSRRPPGFGSFAAELTSVGSLTSNSRRTRKKKVARRNFCQSFCGPVIHPDSSFRSVWNVALALFICYCGIAVPLEISFETDMVESMCGYGQDALPRAECTRYLLWFYFNLVIDVWFMCDIVVNMRTGYVVEGHFVSDDWLAAKNYLTGSFVMDCLGTFPLNLVLMAINPDNPYGDIPQDGGDNAADVTRVNRMLRLLRMAKLAKLARMAKLAKYLDNMEGIINPGSLAVLKLVGISVMCCHWFGCLWWLISDLELTIAELASPWAAGDNNWHPPIWLRNERSFGVKYSHSFFWGAGMVTSLVPRDIEPVTMLESIITIFAMFSGLLLNAFVISSLTAALASMDMKKELIGKQLDAIKSYLVLKAVPSALRSRILEYYEYTFTSAVGLAHMDMFADCPPALSAQLSLTVNRRLVARCMLFRDVSNATLVALISELQPHVFVPGQLITVEGSPLQSIHFVNKGRVTLSQGGMEYRTLNNNDNFGVEDYLAAAATATALGAPVANGNQRTSQRRSSSTSLAIVSFTAKSITYCDMMSLAVSAINKALALDRSYAKSHEADADRASSPTNEKNHFRRKSTQQRLNQFSSRKSSMTSARDSGNREESSAALAASPSSPASSPKPADGPSNTVPLVHAMPVPGEVAPHASCPTPAPPKEADTSSEPQRKATAEVVGKLREQGLTNDSPPPPPSTSPDTNDALHNLCSRWGLEQGPSAALHAVPPSSDALHGGASSQGGHQPSSESASRQNRPKLNVSFISANGPTAAPEDALLNA